MKARTGPTVMTEIPDRQSAPELAPEPLAGLCLKLTKCWRVLFGPLFFHRLKRDLATSE